MFMILILSLQYLQHFSPRHQLSCRSRFRAPAFNILIIQSRNESNANGKGGDIGLLVKPSDFTGIELSGAVIYQFSGKYSRRKSLLLSHNY